MTKRFYQILEISEKATLDEIKKAYKKQALKWHPDKNPSNREEAEKRFKEISKIFQILSDPTTRILYDVYGEGFENLGRGDSDSSSREENIRKTEEEIRKAKAEKRQTEAEYLAAKLKTSTRYISILDISYAFGENLLKGVTEKDLDPNLWHPYLDWREKVWDLEGEELGTFKLQMISAIEEIAKGREENIFEEAYKDAYNTAYNSSIQEAKVSAIKSIEQWLENEGVKAEELEPNNRNYQKAIINFGKGTIEEVIAVERRIKEDIIEKAKKQLPQQDYENQVEKPPIKRFQIFFRGFGSNNH